MLYDFNSINHPNLMGARRSCGQSPYCPESFDVFVKKSYSFSIID
jgi:hypothetical protein